MTGILRIIGLSAMTAICILLPGASLSGGGGASAAAMHETALGAFLAGHQARAADDTAVAARYFATALAQDPDNDLLQRRAFAAYVDDGEFAQAMPLATALAKNGNRTAPFVALVLEADHFRHNRHGAVGALATVDYQSGVMQLIAPILKAWAVLGEGDLQGAMQALAPLENVNAFRIILAYHKALMLGYSGDWTAAADTLGVEIEAGSVDLRTRLVHASLLARRDGPAAAAAWLEGLAPRYGADPVFRAYTRYGRPLASAFPVRNVQDGAAEVFYGVPSALFRKPSGRISRTYLQLALYLRPDMDVAQARLGDLLERSGHSREAIRTYAAIDTESPFKWPARINMAKAYNDLGETVQAENLLRAMAAEQPDNISALTALADMMRAHHRFAEAAGIYAEAITHISKTEPWHWAIHYAQGISLDRTGQWDLAERQLLKALDLNPNQPQVMNYLGYAWADRDEHLDDAADLVSKALQLRPGNGYVIDSMGWIHYRRGEYGQALENLEQAIHLRPQDPVINDHLGDVYWKVGRRLESCFQWRHALNLKPEEKEIPLIKAKMRDGLDGDKEGFRGCRF